MKRVLFVCTHNSARSQMAEGLVNHDLKGTVEAFSAGTDPTFVHPLAVAVLREVGIDISGRRAKSAINSTAVSAEMRWVLMTMS